MKLWWNVSVFPMECERFYPAQQLKLLYCWLYSTCWLVSLLFVFKLYLNVYLYNSIHMYLFHMLQHFNRCHFPVNKGFPHPCHQQPLLTNQDVALSCSGSLRGFVQLCGVLSFIWMLCQCVVYLDNVKYRLPTAAFNRLPDVNGKSITRDLNCRTCLGPGSWMIFSVSNNFGYLEQN